MAWVAATIARRLLPKSRTPTAPLRNRPRSPATAAPRPSELMAALPARRPVRQGIGSDPGKSRRRVSGVTEPVFLPVRPQRGLSQVRRRWASRPPAARPALPRSCGSVQSSMKTSSRTATLGTSATSPRSGPPSCAAMSSPVSSPATVTVGPKKSLRTRRHAHVQVLRPGDSRSASGCSTGAARVPVTSVTRRGLPTRAGSFALHPPPLRSQPRDHPHAVLELRELLVGARGRAAARPASRYISSDG